MKEKPTAKVLWFNKEKGYGHLRDNKGNTYFLHGSVVGGDLYGYNIPDNKTTNDGDTYKILEHKEMNKRFSSETELVVVKTRRLRKSA